MYSKKCFKCGISKEIIEFYKHTKMKDGYLNKCKECTRKDTIDNRNKNIEHYKSYDRSRAMLPHRVEGRKTYDLTDAGKASLIKSRANYKRKFPNAKKAQNAFSNACRDGRIKRRTNCEKCNSTTRVEGHHDDYNFPLSVRWLCCKCHTKWHKNNTPLNRA